MAETLATADIKTNPFGNKNLPLVIEPENSKARSLDNLEGWIKSNEQLIDEKITEHGALLFRKFAIDEPLDFERIAFAVDADLKNNYLGTSPRNAKTKYTFSASELPSYYPIMQHCEMSFLDNPPRKLFFYCNVAPQTGGETPIVDFRKVYAQIDPNIRQEFEEKGIKYIRNYDGPSAKNKFDLWKLKRWDEMFQTTDRKRAEEIAAENNLELTWKGGDNLVLENVKEATIKHPKTGEPVWFNHLQVFHSEAAAIEYKKIRQRQGTFRGFWVNLLTSTMTSMKRGKKLEDQAMNCTFPDGTAIPKAYVQHVEDVIWDNMVFFSWQKGDVLAIDNFSTSHGRMPYTGPRDIMVCWSSDQ